MVCQFQIVFHVMQIVFYLVDNAALGNDPFASLFGQPKPALTATFITLPGNTPLR